MALVVSSSINIWECLRVENCYLCFSLCLFNSLSSVPILLSLIACESGRLSLRNLVGRKSVIETDV